MVICAIIGCSNRSDLDKVRFFSLPTVVHDSLEIPAFTKGMPQLSPVDVEKTRKLANLCIHIERVIGATRQRFSILSSILPIQYMKSTPGNISLVDKIVLICSALNNLCVSVLPVN